jgi:hypothetical protein
VPGVDSVYVAPGGVVHYVESHSYLPPFEFIQAALRCPDYGSPEFQESLRKSNGGNAPPLISISLKRRSNGGDAPPLMPVPLKTRTKARWFFWRS